MKLQDLENEQFEEEHRKLVAAEALVEIELMTKSSADGSGTGKLNKHFTERSSDKSTRARNLFKIAVKSPPAGNMADVANEPSLCFMVPSPNPTKKLPLVFLQLNL